MCSEREAVRAVVFDMDGVLFDSERITRMMWERAGREFGVPDVLEAERCVIGRSFSDTCGFLRERYGSSFPAVEFRTRCSELFHGYTAEHGLPLMPHARECLEHLSGKGVPLALASSTRRAVVDKELSDAGFSQFFRVTVCGDEVPHSKPEPDIYRRACSLLGVEPSLCAAVEDSPNGIRSAHRAGMRCIMVPDQIEPDGNLRSLLWKCCSSLAELEEFL